MKISRKDLLRWASLSALSAAAHTVISACGGGGGDSSSSGSPAPAPAQPGIGLWSNAATWGGAIPTATDAVTISAGQTVTLDTDAVCLSLDIQGSLLAETGKNISLATGHVNVGASGVWTIGTEASPFPAGRTCTITLHGPETGRAVRSVSGTPLGFTNNGVGRSIQVQPGGQLHFIGQGPTLHRTRLSAHAVQGATSLSLADDVSAGRGWKAGDDIVVGPTDFYGTASGSSQKLVLAAHAGGAGVLTTAGLGASRWGRLQYVTDAGMSLTPSTLTGAPVGAATTLDERAFVINLTRNIVVQGANDTAWTANRFGAHCMFMGRTSSIKLDGVQFRRMGQAGAFGRYPLHWHMMSYNMPNGMSAPSDGSFVGAVVGSHFVKNCSVSESGQRMIVIHGTHGVTVDANVGFDITGHAIFLEDGSEQNNTITNNVVLKVRAPTAANKLLNHDIESPDVSYAAPGVRSPQGVSGVWFTNPANTLKGNWVGDSEGAGIWNSFATRCFGLSGAVALNPSTVTIGTWEDNVCMGNQGAGALTRPSVTNDKGDTEDVAFAGSTVLTPIKRLTSIKNAGGGYSNRVREIRYENFICADNAGMDIFGQISVARSVAVNFLCVAESLNNATSRCVSSRRAAFATYHEALNFQDGIMVGYGWLDGVQDSGSHSSPMGGGTFRLWDLYIRPLVKFKANTGIRQINCAAPYRPLPPNLDGYPMTPSGQPTKRRHWSLASALHDVNGLFVPAGRYWIYDVPFLTYSATDLQDVAPAGQNGKHTPDHYFGVEVALSSIYDSTAHPFYEAIRIGRQNAAGTAEVGVWEVGDGNISSQLNGMRHFVTHHGGRYRLSFPGNAPATSFLALTVSGMLDPNDIFLLGVEFSGAVTVSAVWAAANNEVRTVGGGSVRPVVPASGAFTNGRARALTAAATMAAVVSDVTGTLYYQDKPSNTVWFQVKVASLANNTDITHTEALYNGYLPVLVSVMA
ncbi:MAG: hypothetical protein RLZZ618_1457 [Pseudomonadota bacterium]|jgi:hypothetical protein